MAMINDVHRTVARLRNPSSGLRGRLRLRAATTDAARETATPPPSPRSASSAPLDFTLQRVAGRAIGTVVDLIALGSAESTTSEYLVVLDVYDAAREVTWSAVHHQRLSSAALPEWQPGRTVPVLFDPYDRERVLVG